ncbi:hypothetical protein JAAARDRAFT_30501 [Jaapia argillacea MUCL 33604]|uniref:FCH-domain-containing protein n=1 Tax=Jaapia argillacea MUCL 33604 TaxID=933084 RepID=A0A067Q6B6_9AGAM|nr:hypothetical protein JAAARDRAFT_30501 [Jaapia argillacea MUCL 33604]
MTTGQTYGRHLPDQVDRISSLSDAQLDLLSDIRELYRERVALEREYATKLQVLSKKAGDKKAKKMALLVVGSEPTKAWDENAVKQSTLDNAYTQLIASIADAAQDHINLADALNSQVADALKSVEKKHEERNKKQMAFFQKLLADRDRVYSDRTKTKQKYDDECVEVETYRQKQDRAVDDRHADRAAKQYGQQQTDMMNAKNTYLISIDIANKTKEKFYSTDLPQLEDQFQSLQTQLLTQFIKILLQAQTLHSSHLESLKNRASSVQTALTQVDPAKDQDLFIDHNVRPFVAPGDWKFEPCQSHYDTGEMNAEPAPKVFLQNKLSRCKTKLQELAPLLQAKRSEVDRLSKLVTAYTNDGSLGNLDEVTDNYLEAHHQLAAYASSESILKAEIDTIVRALAGDEGAQQPHSFKSSSFSIPTQCGYCKTSIWGLSKQGKTCKVCGLSVHSKCELKVPAECSGTRGSRHGASDSASLSRTSTTETTRSRGSEFIIQTPTPSSFVQPHASTHPQAESHPAAIVLFDFSATSPFELDVSEGMSVHVLEEDDGSGWIKVSNPNGGKGLVPASYIQYTEAQQAGAADPPQIRKAGRSSAGSGIHVRGVYEYGAQGSDELGVQVGALIELTAGPAGGQNYADGWWEGM